MTENLRFAACCAFVFPLLLCGVFQSVVPAYAYYAYGGLFLVLGIWEFTEAAREAIETRDRK